MLVINGCLKGEKTQSLKDYNHEVSELAQESDAQVAEPLFAALTGAAGKSALDVEVQIDQLRMQAQNLASRAKGLSVPGRNGQRPAQPAAGARPARRRDDEDRRAACPTALGGQGKQAIPQIAGDMEIFLASDVIYSQRVAPLIQQTLASDGIHGVDAPPPSRFLPNLGWLEPTTVKSRITGKPPTAQNGAVAPGTHGSSLIGVERRRQRRSHPNRRSTTSAAAAARRSR